ncbi:undecaprenyldiphospho-muramoylpentapeptide beta-N-acetylglucosaminyltransferase [Lactococcus fujiensis]|uniref:UDP-N-acetylglucosamine--N-acetylmuramyl-(pentapeptide) pyrophosphoryl-undecaprenol N-acetylglucosamine transferase n=1 Tax=Lactococcus fujiensis JCM 16395 TaxID=1291764 RepID=A0A2A5RQ62_9LACT|nr:undecaprenyldiphospho-muramoylpentapeptide beta-N-acetylglucosaminyltransferase [Lactococcus fujiensis]PCS01577.1 UDP-diphospho-muramoylpentapeptide beta-N- acetylglucosaminyltransferase [Lactococcus fujiensis JCM 16395]
MRIILTGGGTGGHIYPALAFIKYLKAVEPDSEILYVGTKRGLENKIVPAAGIEFKTVDVQGFKRSLSLDNFRTIAKFLSSTNEAKKIIKAFKPDVVVGTGGYVAGPVLYAAERLHIPTLIHEQNSIPGITNKFLSKKVTKIAVAFEAAKSYFPAEKTFFTGNPRAQEVANLQASDILEKDYGLQKDKKTVVIFGGSRGAMTINEAFKSALPLFEEVDYQVVYASGQIYYDEDHSIFEKYKDSKNIAIRPYISNMLELFASTDLVLCRAGATTIAEVTALGLPTIFVPSPNVTADHQTKNAQALVDKDAAKMIRDADLTGEVMVKTISDIFANEENYQKMSENSRKAGVPDASTRLYQLVKEITK